MKKKKILITGALGQDGKILCSILLKKKYDVFGIIKNKPYKEIDKNIKYKKVDLRDNKKLFDVIDNSVYICLLCGSQQEVILHTSSYKDIDRINISSKYTYDRKVHFRDCINQYQGFITSLISILPFPIFFIFLNKKYLFYYLNILFLYIFIIY